MEYRKAVKEDSESLSKLAYKSKAYWGYSESFMKQCKKDLTVTEDYIEEQPVFLLEYNNRIIAFYSFSLTNNKLEAMFIDPDYIGKGVGKIMWTHLMNKAKELGINEFTLDSEPKAEGFYLKMGAIKMGYSPSTVFPDRKLPRMRVQVI